MSQQTNLIQTVTDIEREFGPVHTQVEGNKVTQSCPECGTIFLQWLVPPDAYDWHIRLASPYVPCCGKLRRIG
jgi:hypothetical protein